MSCERYQDRIALAAGGDLDGKASARLDLHLGSCEGCRELLDGLRRSRRAIGELGRVEIPEEILAGVRAGVLGRIERRRSSGGRLLGFPIPPAKIRRSWLAAAAVLMVLGAGWLTLRWPESGAGDPTQWVAESRPAASRNVGPQDAEPMPEGPTPDDSRIADAGLPEEDGGPPRTESTRPSEVTRAIASLPKAAVSPPPPVPAEPLRAGEPTLVKWHVEDPDLVIYWIVETDEPLEESEHAISEV